MAKLATPLVGHYLGHCAHHERVDYDTMKDASQLLVGFKARPEVRAFFSDLLAGSARHDDV